MVRLLWIARAMLLVSILAFTVPLVLAITDIAPTDLLYVICLFSGIAICLSAVACVILQIVIYIRRRRSPN